MMGIMLDEATTVPEYRAIKNQFCTLFPLLAVDIVRWGRCGSSSIAVELKNGSAMVFTVHGDGGRDWCLQSMNNYIRNGRGEPE